MRLDEDLGWIAAGGWSLRLECCNPDCGRVVRMDRADVCRFKGEPLSRFRMRARCRACNSRVGVKVIKQVWGRGLGRGALIWVEERLRRT